jgi:hypothetical protein
MMAKRNKGSSLAPPAPDSTSGEPSEAAGIHAVGPEDSNLTLGWVMLAFFLAMGMVLESFHLVKLPAYLQTHLRRELWTLAHAHGALFGVINILFGLSAKRVFPQHLHHHQRRGRAASLLRIGSLLVPLGFLFGGIGNAEGDPSLAILLVPIGGVMALIGIVSIARASGQKL